MKKILLVCLLFCVYSLNGQSTFQKIGRFFLSFGRGFLGTVYRTDGTFDMTNVNDNAVYTMQPGTLYRKMDEDNQYLYLKSIGRTEVTAIKEVKACYSTSTPDARDILYKVELADIMAYQRVWQQGLFWNAMMLPVKYRPVINFNGKEYPKEFSTDVSVGQFLGYRVKVGKSYTQFMQAGVFAGPTMIQFPTAAIDANGNPIPDKISNDNLIGFTHGAGLVFQFERLQLGLVIGKDNLGGEKSKQWQYDNQRWYSFAIGYKFFDNK